MLKKLETIWKDPVASAVIAGTILAIAAWALDPYLKSFDLLRRWFGWGALVGLFILLASWYCIFRLWRMRVNLHVVMDRDFAHVPHINLKIRNPAPWSVKINSITFITKEHWDAPDPLREGVTAPVVRFLPKGADLTKISTVQNSIAHKVIFQTIRARGSLEISFMLITDHDPAYAMGMFPFHLGVNLLYGKDQKMPLQDMIVSLHRSTPLSSLTSAQAGPFPIIERADIQRIANAALSVISEGAVCTPEMLELLKEQAHIN